jgi:hypothetical protein
MFSFITRWFGKGKDNEDNEEEVKPWEKGDPIPYTTDFEGAGRIVVSARDCTRDNVVAVEEVVVRPERIATIVSLLSSLSVEGEAEMTASECLEITLTAYMEEVPFAQVKFYNGRLMLDNGKFIGVGASERLLKKQAELHDFIKIDIS